MPIKNQRSKIKNIFIFFVAVCAITFASCESKEPERMTVLPTALDFIADDPVTQTVTVDAKVKNWDATTTFDWINIGKNDGSFTVSAAKYTETTVARSGTITVTAGATQKITLDVHQFAAKLEMLQISAETLVIEKEKTDTESVVIITNVDWDYNCLDDWLTLEKKGYTLYITPKELNFGLAPRSTTITISGRNVAPVALQVTQEVSHITELNTAEGFFYGDIGTGTALFGLDLYDSSDENVGIQIMGFSTYIAAEKFKLDAGTYRLTEKGEAKSFFDGEYDYEEDMFFGSFAYDFNDGKIILITGGTFTVELSDQTYTIVTYLSGRDPITNAAVKNIFFRYTGTIEFENLSDEISFNDVAESDYTATGTPQLTFSSGDANASTWKGKVEPADDDFGQYIEITNFADEEVTIYADFINGKFILDTEYPVWENPTYLAYLEVLLYHNGNFYNVDPSWWDKSIKYDVENRTIDFSKSVVFSDIGLQHFVIGIYAYHKSNGNGAGWLTNIYPDVKLQLTPVAKPEKLSNKAGLKTGRLFLSKLRSSIGIPTQDMITIDKSKLVPVEGMKLDRLKFEQHDQRR